MLHVTKIKVSLRFEVLKAVKMSMLVFWVATPCGLVGRYQRFGEIYLHFKGRTLVQKTNSGKDKFVTISRPTQACVQVICLSNISFGKIIPTKIKLTCKINGAYRFDTQFFYENLYETTKPTEHIHTVTWPTVRSRLLQPHVPNVY
jgi:hypothetical protein